VILARESTPIIDIVYDWLFIPLTSVSQLTYVDHATCAIEAIQEFIYHLPPAINGCRSKVCVLVKRKTFKRSHELLH